MKYNEEDNNGIVKVKQNGVEYTVWTHAKVVRKYIKDKLKKRFPGKLVVKEFNQIDYTIPEENLPIEIQSTPLSRNTMLFAEWEDDIRRQVEQNIMNYGTCWFFFDSALLSGMKNAGKSISINLDWLRKLIKEGKLKVFTISFDGIINDIEYKDFDFLSEISQTCKISHGTDDLTLNRNKIKIYARVVKGYNFTQDEIDKFDDDFEKSSDNNHKVTFLTSKQNDERPKLYGNILHAIGNLSDINQLLYRNTNTNRDIPHIKIKAKNLGIFDTYGNNQNNSVIKFVDRFDICKYFPGYLRNKETWDKLMGHNLNTRQFYNVISGKNDVIKGLDYYFNDDNDISNNIETNIDKNINQDQTSKDINIKIDNKDHIININIKSKQKTIEDAWSN